MALANYTDLIGALASWLNRSDYSALLPDFIALAEAEFNRKLRTMDMDARSTATLSDSIALPADFAGIRSISISGTYLSYVSASDFFSLDLNGEGYPFYYTIADGQFFFAPFPSGGNVTITYHQKIPALTSTNATNWLMTRAPDLYLFGALAQAEFYGWNDERLPMIKSRVDEIIDQIEIEESKRSHGSASLAPRLQAPAFLA